MVPAALPFWLPITLLPLTGFAAVMGEWWMLVIPVYAWVIMSALDAIGGLNLDNPDPNSKTSLFWHLAVTWVWPPLQIITIFVGIWYATTAPHLAIHEQIGLMAAIGVTTGAIGINFAHELIHQRNRWEVTLGDLLLISTLYGHFRTEHLQVHHRFVGTPHDPVTARYNESFWHFFPRVLWQQIASSWAVEAQRQAKRGEPTLGPSNPFLRYWGGGLAFMALAYAMAGGWGVALFSIQAFVAILHLELVNYIEHYGLVRMKDARGRYEPVKPRHSWNASHRVTNWLLINLQRHSDHHYKPNRRFPLLQTYSTEEAPQLPFGYPGMLLLASNPLLFRRVMNPRVRAWRKQFYPEVEDWSRFKHPDHGEVQKV